MIEHINIDREFKEWMNFLSRGGKNQVNRIDLHEKTFQAAVFSTSKKYEARIKELEKKLNETKDTIKFLLDNIEHTDEDYRGMFKDACRSISKYWGITNE